MCPGPKTPCCSTSTPDVGVAVSIPGGLITPVIRDADQKTLSAISNEMKDLAGARQGAAS